MDDAVGEVQGDFIQREIGVLDLLLEDDVAVAIVACKRRGAVGTYGELPDLKFFGGDTLVVGLNDRDLVQKPICSTVLGNVLCAVGIENVAVDPVPIPILAARKLREVAFAENLCRRSGLNAICATVLTIILCSPWRMSFLHTLHRVFAKDSLQCETESIDNPSEPSGLSKSGR